MELPLNTTKRFRLIMELGGKCRICLHDKVEHIEIDHIYNDGAEERTKYGAGEKMWAFYLSNLDLAFRRLQPLCKNCHAIKTWSKQDDDGTSGQESFSSKTYEMRGLAQYFMDAIKKLEGPEKRPVPQMELIAELGEKENEDMQFKWNGAIKKMVQEAAIYESLPRHYNSV